MLYIIVVVSHLYWSHSDVQYKYEFKIYVVNNQIVLPRNNKEHITEKVSSTKSVDLRSFII